MSDTNETVENNDGEDLSATIEQLRADLAAEKAEKAKVDKKNKELIAEKQKIKSTAEEARTATSDYDNLKQSLQNRENELRDIRISHALAAGMSANSVRPELVDALSALLKSKVDYEDGEANIAGRSIGDYMKSYLTGKDGAHFVRPADNSGGGAQGNGTPTPSYPMNAQNWDNAKYMEIAAADPQLAKAMALAAGKIKLAATL